jgi:hypothetical protein
MSRLPHVPGARELPAGSVPTSAYERVGSVRAGREDLDVGVRVAGPRVTILVGDRALTPSEAQQLRDALEGAAHVVRTLADPQRRLDFLVQHGVPGEGA